MTSASSIEPASRRSSSDEAPATTVAEMSPHLPKPSRRGLTMSQFAWVMLAPMIVILAAFTIYPFVTNVVYSVTAQDLSDPTRQGFVGLENFEAILARPQLVPTLARTALFTTVGLIVELVVGCLVAALIFQRTRGASALTLLLMLPFGLTPVALALAWRLMLNPSGGAVNGALEALGLRSVSWTTDPTLAFVSVTLVDIWQWAPFVAIIVIAGLYSLPRDQFEAAAVDGLGFWSSMVHIGLPLLRPLILLVVVFRSIDLLRTFDTIWLITGGGPGRATEILNTMLYRVAFSDADLGQAAALALLMLIVIAVVTRPFVSRLLGTLR